MTMRWMIGSLLVFGLFASGTRAAETPTLQCIVSVKYICALGGRCASIAEMGMKPDSWSNLYTTPAAAYERCEPSGCSRWNASITHAKEYTIVDLPGRGAFVKIAPDLSFTEVATITSNVLVSYGFCRQP